MLSVNHGHGRVVKIPSYLGTESRSSQPKPDEVKMVLYIVQEYGMPCFSLAVTEGQMCIRTAEVRPYYFFVCFGRGTSVACHDQGGGLAFPESCWGFCRSRYDAKITRNRRWRQLHHWRPTLMYLGCMIEIHIYIYMLATICFHFFWISPFFFILVWIAW